jgi:putative tryptophan/tyrosine transport system substrate-binding protein
MGLAASLARPGSNVTGIAILTDDLEVKNLQLLKQTVPSASRVAVLWNPDNPLWVTTLKRLQETASSLGLRVQSLEVWDPGDFAKAFASARGERADTLLVVREALPIP